MPRYFFHVLDGVSITDREGAVLADFRAAKREALKIAEGLITSTSRTADLGEEWRVEVTNETGALLFRMDFIVTENEGSPPFFPA